VSFEIIRLHGVELISVVSTEIFGCPCTAPIESVSRPSQHRKFVLRGL
jgi:hypothetical protein